MRLLLLITFFFSLTLFAKPIVVVSILPQQTFVQKIGGDKITLALMVQPGSSPHSYEPKSSQMRAISNAALYFAADVEFEHVWLKKFQAQNKKLHIVDTTKNITKIKMLGHHHHGRRERSSPPRRRE